MTLSDKKLFSNFLVSNMIKLEEIELLLNDYCTNPRRDEEYR